MTARQRRVSGLCNGAPGNEKEFDFRYNNRQALEVDDTMRAAKALAGIEGKRLTYRRANGR